ncbi:chaperonin 10-like protein [Lipomyces arxii]|uniref:chaperonin 10-like protein n=1 Tax=Lipomyces arxii TaxID=56418 RepID=UPI0034CF77EC
MKEAIVTCDGINVTSEIIESPIPVPGQGEILIKVVVSGTNPKDWKYPYYTKTPMDSGDDIAGYVESFGQGVIGFSKGDRVAAFHKMGYKAGSFAEYALAFDYSTFHIPAHTSFEEASTIPLAALTAAYGLFDTLKLPTPWQPAKTSIPLLVWGASTSVGAFAVKLAKLAGIGPIIGVAGQGSEFAKSIGVDFVVDYRAPDVVHQIRKCLSPGQKLEYAWDTISEKGSYQYCISAMEPGSSHLSLILPERRFDDIGDGIDYSITAVANAHKDNAGLRDFGYFFYKLVSKWLVENRLSGHPYETVSGLEGVGPALKNVLEGKNSAFKYVIRVD